MEEIGIFFVLDRPFSYCFLGFSKNMQLLEIYFNDITLNN